MLVARLIQIIAASISGIYGAWSAELARATEKTVRHKAIQGVRNAGINARGLVAQFTCCDLKEFF
jgi:hypothetical protein